MNVSVASTLGAFAATSLRTRLRAVRALQLAAMLLSIGLAGCATTAADTARPVSANDPFEPFNRKMFAFNDALDNYALKPAAQGYQKVVPQPVRTGVHNVFSNFSDAWSTVNLLLQGKLDNTALMTMRVMTNTFLGFGGLLDVATSLGLERRTEDFGQTLGRWGVPPGPYLVLPVFGPSDIRDAIALPADTYASPSNFTATTAQAAGVTVLSVVDARAGLLNASQIFDDIALDRYSFLRDGYLARRRNLIYDGNPPAGLSEPDDPQDKGLNGDATPAPSLNKPVSLSDAEVEAGQAATSMSAVGASPVRVPFFDKPGDTPPLPRYATEPAPPPLPMPVSGVSPAPLPASAPALPIALPVPPPPPASSPRV